MIYPDPLDYSWWIASRSAGVIALCAVSLSVIIGLMMANGLPRKKGYKAKLVKIHEASALIGLVAIAVHAITLLGDQWLKPTIAQLVIPFQMSYEPLMTGLGVIAAWLAVAVGLSFYARRYIGAKRWRSLHKLSALVWVGALIHAIGAGSDTGALWMQAVLLASGVPILILLAMRILGGRNRKTEPNPRVALKPRASEKTPQPAEPHPPLPPGMKPWSPARNPTRALR